MENKKPAVKAKTARRGRPVGSKNKKTPFDSAPKVRNTAKSFTEEVAAWEAEPREEKVDYKDLCQRLQDALAKSYVEIDGLKKEIEELNIWLQLKQKTTDECEKLLVKSIKTRYLDFKRSMDQLAKDDEDFAI